MADARRTTAAEVSEQCVAEWIDTHYKPDRLNRDTGTRSRLIADSLTDLRASGSAFISRHDSVSGHVEILDV